MTERDPELVPGGKAARLLEYIQSYMYRQGYAPAIREMATALDASTSHVHWLLGKLEKGGYIRRGKKVSRSIVLIK